MKYLKIYESIHDTKDEVKEVVSTCKDILLEASDAFGDSDASYRWSDDKVFIDCFYTILFVSLKSDEAKNIMSDVHERLLDYMTSVGYTVEYRGEGYTNYVDMILNKITYRITFKKELDKEFIGHLRYLKKYNLFENKKDEVKLPNLSDLTIVELKTIEGKNKWHHTKDKLIHMVLELGDWEEFPSDKIPDFYKNIKKYIPSMYEHRCSPGRKGGFFSRVKRGTWLGHIIEHIALELQTLIGHDTGFGRTRGTKKKKGQYNVIFNYEEKSVGLLAAKEAIKVAKSLIKGEDPEIDNVLKKLKSKLK
jgi:hypothetical protein